MDINKVVFLRFVLFWSPLLIYFAEAKYHLKKIKTVSTRREMRMSFENVIVQLGRMV